MGDGESDAVQPALLNAFLLTTRDALMVLEAARRGICPVVTRRLHDSEKTALVGSGTVFAFDENATGIKRWTDGALWSPSRIIGNFLVYRELEKKNANDNDKSNSARPATSNSERSSSPRQPLSDPFGAIPVDSSLPANASGDPRNVEQPFAASPSGSTGLQRDLERALVGSLTTSYRFKKDGLVKKTISNGSLHIICYYTIDDVVAGRLRTPSSLNELASLEISPGLLNPKNFRVPPMLEYDIAGNPRYAGEETEATTGPSVLAPLLSTSRSAPIPIPPSAYEPYRRQSLGIVTSPGAISPVARQMSVSVPFSDGTPSSYTSRLSATRPSAPYPEGSGHYPASAWDAPHPSSAISPTLPQFEAPYSSKYPYHHAPPAALGLFTAHTHTNAPHQRPSTAGPLAGSSALQPMPYPGSRRASDASYNTSYSNSYGGSHHHAGPSTFTQSERQRSETVPSYIGSSSIQSSFQQIPGTTASYTNYPGDYSPNGKYLPGRTSGQAYYSGRPTYSADMHFQQSEFPASHPEEPSSTGLPGFAEPGYYRNEHPPIEEHPQEPPDTYTYDQQALHGRSPWQSMPRQFP